MLLCPVVCLDRERRSTIVVKVDKTDIHHIPMSDIELKLETTHYTKFTFKYQPTDYPVPRAAAHFLAHGERVIMARAVKQQLRDLAGKTPPSLLTKNEREKLNNLVSYVDFRREPVQSVTGAPLPSTTDNQEQDEMATKKKPAAKPVAKKAPAKAAKSAATEKKGRKPGVGALITEGLLKGDSDEKILAAIAKEFPASKSGQKDVSWYRSKLKREGQLK